MIIKELEEQLLALKLSEKVQVIQLLAQNIKATDLANAWVYAADHEAVRVEESLQRKLIRVIRSESISFSRIAFYR